MEKYYNSVTVNKNEFSVEDAIDAAKQIFNAQSDDFYSLKDQKWYQHLLNAITFDYNGRKKVIKNIRSLSKLQSIFMYVYYENYKDMDRQLNDIIENLAETNQVVKKLYLNCVIGIRPQDSIEQLSELDQNILLLMVSSYKSINGKEEKLKRYRASIAKAAGISLPQGAFNPEQLEKVSAVEVIYRCIAEMRVLDETDVMPGYIEEALENLNLSRKKKINIDKVVLDEATSFGLEYIATKYLSKDESYWNDIELADEEIEAKCKVPNEVPWLDISNECAQIYFKELFSYDKKRKNIETASYIVYCDSGKIFSIQKTTGKKEEHLSGIENVYEMFERKCICANQDVIYYIHNNDIKFLDLVTKNEGRIKHIDEQYDEKNNLKEIWNISFAAEDKMVYECGYDYYIISLEDTSEVMKISLGDITNSYFVYQNDIYFLESHIDFDDWNNGKKLSGYKIRKYCIDNGEKVDVSVSFAKRDIFDINGIKALYNVVLEGMYEQYYYVIFEYNSVFNVDSRFGFDCFYFDVTDTGNAEEHRFYIWNTYVDQIEQYGKYLTYVNASKGYKLVKHNFINDKKEMLLKDCGTTEKADRVQRSAYGKGAYMHSNPYMRVGNWIWIKQEGKTTPKLIKF